VTSVSFYKEEALVSVGADSWIHFYDLRRNEIVARCQLAPPPVPPLKPPPASVVEAMPLAPLGLAVDTKGNLRLLDVLRGEKMATVFCRDTAEEEQDVGDEVPDFEEPPSRIIATSHGFVVVGQTRIFEAAEDSEAVTPAETPDEGAEAQVEAEQRSEFQSWLVFFDVAMALAKIFPGIAARIARGDAIAELLCRLSKEEMQNLPGNEATKIFQPQTSTSSLLRRSTIDTRKSALVTSGQSITDGTNRRSSSKPGLSPGGASGEVVALTAENLQKMSTRRSTSKSSIKAPSILRSSEAYKSATVRPGPDGAAGVSRQAIPLNWQASVKQNLRRCVESKNLRQANLSKRMEAIRKELECN
jgi:hypothetical protein